MLANEFLAFEHSPLFFVDIIIHCSLLRTCRVRVEEKEEFLVYTVLWTLTCHPYLESATALSDSAYLCCNTLPCSIIFVGYSNQQQSSVSFIRGEENSTVAKIKTIICIIIMWLSWVSCYLQLCIVP